MKIKGRLKRCNNNCISFELPYKLELELGKDYSLEIKPYKSSRSIEQNSLLWGLIQQISDETGNDPMDIYISALEKANAKYDYLQGLEEIEDDLKKVFRAVKPMNSFVNEKGKTIVTYKVWFGSSKFDSAEMTKLIDYVIGIADELNIYLIR